MLNSSDNQIYYQEDLRFNQLINLVKSDQILVEELNENQLKAINEISSCHGKIRRLLALLNYNLRNFTNPKEVSQITRAELRNASVEAGILVLAHKKQISVLADTLSANGIPFILLKGAAFEHYLYSNQAPRISNDIDILIKSVDWNKAVNLINQKMNYSEKPVSGKFADLYEVSYKPKEKTGFHLDVHKLLIHPYLFDIEENILWEESIPHPYYNNKNIRILSPEFNILHLAIHAYKDMDFYNYNLVDCHRLIMKTPIDWQKLVAYSNEIGAKNILYFLLINCQKVLNSQIPKPILQQCKPNKLIRKFASYLLLCSYAQKQHHTKSLKYRLMQICSQFVFTGSLLRPLKLQMTYLGILRRFN